MRMRSGRSFARDGLLDAATCPNPKLGAITAKNQQDSPFLRLPPEIRDRIFKYAVGGRNIYIYYSRREDKQPALTKSPDLEDVEVDDTGVSERAPLPLRYHSTSAAAPLPLHDFRGHPTSKEHEVPLSQAQLTCRQIYQETVLLLYSANMFSFSSDWAAGMWLKSLRPAQRRVINTVVDPVPSRWRVFNQLEGLKTVYLYRTLLDHWPDYMEVKEKTWKAKGVTVKYIGVSSG